MKKKKVEFVKDAYKLIVREPLTVERSALLTDAVARLLKDPRHRTVFVLEDNAIKGLITTRELIRILAVEERLDNTKPLRECAHTLFTHEAECVMNKQFVSVTPGDRLADVIKKMEEHDMEELPVVDENGGLIGIINGLEILAACRKLGIG